MNNNLKFCFPFLHQALNDIETYLSDPNYNIDKDNLFKLHKKLNDKWIKIDIVRKYNYDLRVQMLFCEDIDFNILSHEDIDFDILSHLAKITRYPEVLDKLSHKLKVNPESKVVNYLILLYDYIFKNPVCTEEIQLRLIDNAAKLDKLYFIADIPYNNKTTSNVLLHIAKFKLTDVSPIANHPNVTLPILEILYESGHWDDVFASPKCTKQLRESIIDKVLDSDNINSVDFYLLHYDKYNLDPEKRTKLELKAKELEAKLEAEIFKNLNGCK